MRCGVLPSDEEFFQDLLKSRLQAVSVSFDPNVIFHDGSKPEVAHCHDNADKYVSDNPDCDSVRGWLLQEHDQFWMWKIVAHSIVRRPDGTIFDITPLGIESERRSFKFLPHSGNEDSFHTIRRRNPEAWCSPSSAP